MPELNNKPSVSVIHLKPSVWLTLFFTAIIMATLGTLYFIDLPPLFWLFSVVLVACAGVWVLGQYAWLIWPLSIRTIYTQLDSKDQLLVTVSNRAGATHAVVLQTDTLISPALSVLVFKLSAKSLWPAKSLITCDNCSKEEFRKFRVISRMSNPLTKKPGSKL